MSSSETLLSSHTACATPSRGPALLRFDSSQPLSLTQSLLRSHPTVQLRRSSLHALDPVYVCNSQPSSMGSPLRSHKSSLQLLLDFFISADNLQTSPSLSFLPTYLPILGPHCFSGTTVLVPLASGGSPSDSFKFINMPSKCCPQNRTHRPSSGLLPFSLLVSLWNELQSFTLATQAPSLCLLYHLPTPPPPIRH